mmetsp:Transcript_153715/g.492827  ORF Transcript_153715/g.492827 Transcript_153715/m.492827 type:complete len:233 (+) Transcript_153715:135-833(+)
MRACQRDSRWWPMLRRARPPGRRRPGLSAVRPPAGARPSSRRRRRRRQRRPEEWPLRRRRCRRRPGARPCSDLASCLQRALEGLLRLPGVQALQESPAEASRHAAVPSEAGANIGLAQATAQRHDTQHVRVLDKREVQVVLAGDGEPEDDPVVGPQAPQALQQHIQEELLASCLLGATNSDLRLKHGHQAAGQNVAREVQLLVDQGPDAIDVGALDQRARLGAEDAGSRSRI